MTRCVRAKAAVVAADERDTGRRLVLNYGHTLGHALERLDAFAGRTHGEAISAGMVFAARLAEALGRADAGARGAARPPARVPRAGDGRDAAARGGDPWPRSGWTRSTAAGSASCCWRTSVVPSWRMRSRGRAPHHARAGRLGRTGDGGCGCEVLFLFGPNLGALGRREPGTVRHADARADHGRGGRTRRPGSGTSSSGVRPITRAS